MVVEHLKMTSLCPLIPDKKMLRNGRWSGQARRCRMAHCQHAHELWELELPKWCYDSDHPHRKHDLSVTHISESEWDQIHFYVGQNYSDYTKELLLRYSLDIPSSFLPDWYHLFCFVEKNHPMIIEQPLFLTMEWDFGHKHRIDILTRTLGEHPPIPSLKAPLLRRLQQLDDAVKYQHLVDSKIAEFRFAAPPLEEPPATAKAEIEKMLEDLQIPS